MLASFTQGKHGQTEGVEYDVFICHASEDKVALVEPLVAALERRGLRVWLDQMQIMIGDSLTERIDDGLAHSRFGVVIVSPAVLAKETWWVRRELNALAAREAQEGRVVVLPVWHEVSAADVMKYSPTLAAKLAAETKDGIDAVAGAIAQRCAAAEPKPDRQTPSMAAFETLRSLTKPTDMVLQDLRTLYNRAYAIYPAFDAPIPDDVMRQTVGTWYSQVSELLEPYPREWEVFKADGATELSGQNRDQLRSALRERALLLKSVLDRLHEPSSRASPEQVAGRISCTEDRSTAERVESSPSEVASAFTSLWRVTLSGFEAPLAMNLAQMVLPGYNGIEPQALVRVGVAMGSEALASDASSSVLGRKFVEFLDRGASAALVDLVADQSQQAPWRRLAGTARCVSKPFWVGLTDHCLRHQRSFCHLRPAFSSSIGLTRLPHFPWVSNYPAQPPTGLRH